MMYVCIIIFSRHVKWTHHFAAIFNSFNQHKLIFKDYISRREKKVNNTRKIFLVNFGDYFWFVTSV